MIRLQGHFRMRRQGNQDIHHGNSLVSEAVAYLVVAGLQLGGFLVNISCQPHISAILCTVCYYWT